jgi:hypothetical protein
MKKTRAVKGKHWLRLGDLSSCLVWSPSTYTRASNATSSPGAMKDLSTVDPAGFDSQL